MKVKKLWKLDGGEALTIALSIMIIIPRFNPFPQKVHIVCASTNV